MRLIQPEDVKSKDRIWDHGEDLCFDGRDHLLLAVVIVEVSAWYKGFGCRDCSLDFSETFVCQAVVYRYHLTFGSPEERDCAGVGGGGT